MTKRRLYILTVVALLLGGVLLNSVDAVNLGRFAIFDSTLTNAVTVTSNRLVVDGSGVTQPVSIAATVSNNTAQIGGNTVVTGGVNGSQGVGGLAASGASKAGNPVLTGGVFNTTQPTVTNGQSVDAQSTARGGRIVATGVDDFVVVGGSSDNSATSTKKVPIISAKATASDPSWTEGNQAPNSVDLQGYQRVFIKENGLTTHYRTSTASTNAVNIKASSGILYSFDCTNTDTTHAFLAFHNTAGTPTAGASIFRRYLIPAGSGHSPNVGGDGIAFSTGIAFTLTQGEADSSTTAVPADKIKCNFEYR